MRYIFDGIKKKPHPEEAAQAAVSKDAQCRSNASGGLCKGPAKAGIRRRPSNCRVGPGFRRGCENWDCYMNEGGNPLNRSGSSDPQDDDMSLTALKKDVLLRRRRSGRLEGRAMPIQGSYREIT